MTIRELLTLDEGRVNHIYPDSEDISTIGVGHNVEARPLPEDIQDYLDAHGEITEAMIDRLLTSDIEMATFDALELWPNLRSFSENRQAALIDLSFNMGEPTLREFIQTNKAINEGHWEEAAFHLIKSLWFRQVGSRGKRIVAMIRKG